MSLFDVIRYPISDPITPAEYEQLPDTIKNRWMSTLPAGIIFAFWSDKESLTHLRKIIREYDEPI